MNTKEIFQQACLKWLNVWYKWGGDDSKGIDCSGLVQELYAMIGLDPSGDQTAQAYYDHFKNISEVDRSPQVGLAGSTKYKCGSLVFFGSSPTSITHIGMIIADNSKMMIEAAGGGSKTVNEQIAAQQNAFVKIRPYDRRKDVVAVLTPRDLPW